MKKQQGKKYMPKERQDIFEGLTGYFRLGFSRNKACQYLGFDPSTLCRWEKEDPELSKKIDQLIIAPDAIARSVLIEGMKDGDKDLAKWWAERREKKEFSTRVESDITTDGEKISGFEVTFVDKKNA